MRKTGMRIPLVDLKLQHRGLAEELEACVRMQLERADFILGEQVGLFEAEFARYIGRRHAVGVASGSAALELGLRAYGIGPGDEVITAANTFIATVLAILSVGATPVLADVEPETYTLDPDAVSAAVSPRTRALIPVHLYGRPADMDRLLPIASRHHLVVLEDAAQAHGARLSGKRVGSLGRAAAFSFYPTKNLGACGDAGLFLTDDPQAAEKVRRLRNYGQAEKYRHLLAGVNSRLDSLQAAVLRVKLPHLDAWNAQRRAHAERYAGRLGDLPARLKRADGRFEHVYHLCVVEVPQRDRVRTFLEKEGVETGIHYPIPAHLQPACASLGYRSGSFPVTEALCERILSLPMYPELTNQQIDDVAERLGRALR